MYTRLAILTIALPNKPKSSADKSRVLDPAVLGRASPHIPEPIPETGISSGCPRSAP